jgi:hypothetical protein
MSINSSYLYYFDNQSLGEYNPQYTLDPTFADYLCYSATKNDHPTFDIDRDFLVNNLYYYPEHLNKYAEAYENNKINFPVFLDIEFNLNRSVPSSAINNLYRRRISLTPPQSFYPIATRYISDSGYFVIERPPFQIDLDYKLGRASSRTKKRLTDRKLWIPWTIFIFNPKYPQGYKYFFSDSSLLNNDHKYISPYIPNTYINGDICFSNSLSNIPQDSLPDSSDISHFYSTVFNDFFSGGWNSDLNNPWHSLINQLQSRILAKIISKDHISQTYPILHSLLYPQEEILQPLLSKNSKLKEMYDYCQKYPHVFLACLDSQTFHYVILYILSTFDLPEILQLISEIFNLSTTINSSVHKDLTHKFSDIVSSIEEKAENTLHHNIKLTLDQAIDYNADDATFFTGFSAKLLLLNPPCSYRQNVRPRNISSYWTSYFMTQEAHLAICHKVLSDLSSEINPSDRLYVYDFHSGTINSHLLNTSIYNYYLTLMNNNFSVPTILTPLTAADVLL